MKEKLYTIPLNDAVNAGDECPFCFVERSVEQDLIDFILGAGSSYMEADIRDLTDREGFCRAHWQKLYDYGNTLGNGWILKTHYLRLINEMKGEFKKYAPAKTSLKNKFSKNNDRNLTNPLAVWAQEKSESCYICRAFAETYARYMDTFFVMYKGDADFRERVGRSKGFCLTHFGDLCEAADRKLSDKEKTDFYPMLFKLMEENMERLAGDVAWLVEKFDYRNKDADWKNSRDAIQRGMQKIKGGYPADPVYKKD
jgi:hypothetical protein